MPSETERYWGSICLGIVTIATAAIGVALFSSGLVDDQIPKGGPMTIVLLVIKFGSAVLAIVFYLVALYGASRIIVPSPAGLQRDGATTSKRVFWVYALFFGELLALLVLLAADLSLNFLHPPAMPAEPMALLLTA